MKEIIRNFVLKTEEQGKTWKKSQVYLFCFVTILAALGLLLNAAKAQSKMDFFITIVMMPVVFIVVFKNAILLRVFKAKNKKK